MRTLKYRDVLVGLLIVCAITLLVRTGRMRTRDCWTTTPSRQAQALWHHCQDQLERRWQHGSVTEELRLVRASDVYDLDNAKVFKVELVQVPADATDDVVQATPFRLIIVMKRGKIVCYPGDHPDGPFSELFH